MMMRMMRIATATEISLFTKHAMIYKELGVSSDLRFSIFLIFYHVAVILNMRSIKIRLYDALSDVSCCRKPFMSISRSIDRLTQLYAFLNKNL